MKWSCVLLLASCLVVFAAKEAEAEHCFWSGTAPFCEGRCPWGYGEKRRDHRGDGEPCATGSKAFCCQICTWFGTAPFCSGSCPHGYNLVKTDKANCWTGSKAECCPA